MLGDVRQRVVIREEEELENGDRNRNQEKDRHSGVQSAFLQESAPGNDPGDSGEKGVCGNDQREE